MRWILSLLSIVALAFSATAHAQEDLSVEDPGVLATLLVEGKGYASALLIGRCKVIVADHFLDDENNSMEFIQRWSSWSGSCNAQGLADGQGRLRLCSNYNGNGIACYEYQATLVNGLLQGRVLARYLSGNTKEEGEDGVFAPVSYIPDEWREYKDGCNIEDMDDDDYACTTDSALQLQARYMGAGAAAASTVAASDAVGQNRGKGGNPDWMYDDTDHGKCVSVEGVPATGGSGLAYGHYKLINSCAYPLEMRLCVTPDRLDGSDSNYDLHQDGAKCPGMGWGAGTIDANEVQNGREWFEYNHLKWDIQVCRKGWDFIGEDGRYPSDILGVPYGCRTRRPSK